MKKYLISLFIFAFSMLAHAMNILVISDIHLDTDPHVMDMAPREFNKANDLDSMTYAAFLARLNTDIEKGALTKPDLILLLGDIVGHERNLDKMKNEQAAVFKSFKQVFPTIPVFFVSGNNDSFDKDYGPFDGEYSPYKIAKENGWPSGFLSLGEMCQTQMQFPCLQNSNSQQGYYTAALAPQLKLIALNTTFFSTKRVDIEADDIEKQFSYLEQELTTAEKNHESVLIAVHIPPGHNAYDDSSFWQPKEEARFLQLITHYQKNIIGMIAAHTHMEEIKLIKQGNQIISSMIFAPGLSTSHGNAPGVKMISLQEKDRQWSIQNFDTYFFVKQNDQISLQKLYNFHDYYCSSLPSNLKDCLANVSAEKIKNYYGNGNSNFKNTFRFPEDIFITI